MHQDNKTTLKLKLNNADQKDPFESAPSAEEFIKELKDFQNSSRPEDVQLKKDADKATNYIALSV